MDVSKLGKFGTGGARGKTYIYNIFILYKFHIETKNTIIINIE